MSRSTVTFVREALYAEVWREPLRTVARRHALSDVGLRKICHRLGVPTPRGTCGGLCEMIWRARPKKIANGCPEKLRRYRLLVLSSKYSVRNLEFSST